jgi:O-antigen/teichoic acid export membrane protein
METAKRILKNALYLGAAEVVSRILQFAVMLFAARELSVEGFGAFNFALALSFVAMILADMGLNTLLIRTIARDKALLEKFLVNALYLKALFSLATFLGIWLVLALFGYGGQTLEVALIMVFFAALSMLTDFIYSIFRSFERMEFDSMLKVLRMSLLAFFSIIALMRGSGVVVFSLLFVVVECITLLVGFIIVSSTFVTRRLRFSWLDSSYRQKIRNEAFPFGLSAAFGSLYFYASVLILSVMLGDLAVAQFSSAYNIVLALLFIPTVYTNALYPAFSRMFAQSKRDLSFMYAKSMKYLFMVGLPIALCLFLLSEEIMTMLYGGKYDAASAVLEMIALYIVLKFLNFLLGITLSSADRQWERMKVQAIAAGVSVALCAVLIWKLGVIGAAYAMVITELILFTLYMVQARKVVSFPSLSETFLKPIAASVVLMLCAVLLPFSPIVSAAVGLLFYALALFIAGALDNEDKKMMKAVFSNGKV